MVERKPVKGKRAILLSSNKYELLFIFKEESERSSIDRDNNIVLINLGPLFFLPISNTIGTLPYNFNICTLFSNNFSYDLRLFQHICYSNSSILSGSHSATPFLALLFKLV